MFIQFFGHVVSNTERVNSVLRLHASHLLLPHSSAKYVVFVIHSILSLETEKSNTSYGYAHSNTKAMGIYIYISWCYKYTYIQLKLFIFNQNDIIEQSIQQRMTGISNRTKSLSNYVNAFIIKFI